MEACSPRPAPHVGGDALETDARRNVAGSATTSSDGLGSWRRRLDAKQQRRMGTLAWILFWYVISIALVLYNKWLFSPKPKGHAFPLPILVTAFHMFTNATFAVAWMGWKGTLGRNHPEQEGMTSVMWAVAPVSLFLGLEIALTNTSFVYLEASFVEMVKPLTLAWTLVLSFGMHLVKPSFKIGCTVLLMILGQVLITYQEAEFVLKGFVIVVLATVMAACRCVIVQLLLQGKRLKEKLNPLQAMAYIMPGAGVILLAAAFIPYKTADDLCSKYPHYCSVIPKGQTFVNEYQLLFWSAPLSGYSVTFMIVCLGACLAILLNLSEFFIIGRNSAMTLAIAGFAKLMILFIFTTMWLKESLTLGQLAGLGLALVGVWWYNKISEDEGRICADDVVEKIGYDPVKVDVD